MRLRVTFSFYLLTAILLFASISTMANSILEEKTITGVVTDAANEPLIGVNVSIEGTSVGTVTDVNGAYAITADDDATTITFSYIGYVTQKVAINERSEINITLEVDNQVIDEVVVIGYGTQKKSDVTGAIAPVNVKEIQKIPTGDVATALQGQVAGVNVAASTGAPGNDPVVRIRGLGTIGDNNPLYIIDGIPGDISYLNPFDIETMNVLKDASTATIYGARASNGVIIITTKKGDSGAPKVSLNTFWGFHNLATNNIDVANKTQYNQISQEARANGGEAPLDFTLDDSQYADTDWGKEYLKTGFEQKYDLGISGGSDKVKYFFSGGYYNHDGTVINTGFERFNTRLNLDFSLFNDRLTISPGFGYARANKNSMFEPTENGNASFSHFIYTYSALPHKEVYDSNSPNGFATPPSELGSGNPIGEQSLTTDISENEYVQTNITADLLIVKGLTYQFQYGSNVENIFDYFHVPKYNFGPQATVEDPLISEDRARISEWALNNTLTYKESFGPHNLGLMIGGSREKRELRSTGGENRKLSSSLLEALSAGIGDEASFGFNTTTTIQSLFGRLNYNFKDKYIFQASLRRDGSSRFAKANRYGTFYSVSAGWAMHKEDWFNSSFMSIFKPRVSYGTLGNQNIGDHLFLSRITLGGAQLNYPFGDAIQQAITVGAISTSLPTPDIKWEETQTTNIGIDLGFFENKWLFTFDYYMSNTVDMLVTIPIPASSGITMYPLTNGGEMENKGWEIATTYRHKSGDFQWDITGNLSHTENKVTKLGFADEAFTDGFIEFVNYPTTRTEVGGEIAQFYVYQVDGIFQNQGEIDAHGIQPNAQPGDFKFVNTNGDDALNDEDKVFLGSGLANLEYGLTFNGYYKNFDLSIFFQGTQGNKMYNGMKMWLYRSDRVENVSSDLVNAWRPDNTGSNIPRNVSTDPNTNIRASDYFLEDASYFRLRNLQIGYTIPEDTSKKAAISKARIYIGATNLFTITDYTGFDPAMVSDGLFTRGVDRGYYPITKSFIIGLNLGF